MIFKMVNRTGKQHKIFNSIIGGISINMMNNFRRLEISTKMFFHNKKRKQLLSQDLLTAIFRYRKTAFSLATIIIACLLINVNNNLYAQPVQRITIEPLSGGVSFNTVTLGTGWVTAPTVEMVGRKRICITNTSTTENIYVTGVSGSTATGIIYPRERAYFNASNTNHIYVSANTATSCQVWEIR